MITQSQKTAYNSVSITYDAQNKPAVVLFNNAGNAAVATNYSYVAGGFGTNSTSPLVQTISQPTGSLTYAYDATGNITSVSDGSKTISYVYDMIGQLTRANDPYDTTAGSSGTTWIYTYDLGGNILSKTAYAYTTGTAGSAVQTNSYSYTDANWKDKLTAFNGKTITYDAIGNPRNDGAWNYTWAQGRQLRSLYKGSFGAAGYDEISFKYIMISLPFLFWFCSLCCQ